MYGMSETMLITLDNPKPLTNATMDRNDIIKSNSNFLNYLKQKLILDHLKQVTL